MSIIIFFIAVGVLIVTAIIIKIFDSDIRQSHLAKLTIDIVVFAALFAIIFSLTRIFMIGV